MKPFPFQEKDLQTLAENNYTALLNMQPGAGKTPTALWASQNSGASQTLVIAPLNTHHSAWQKTGEKLGIDVRVMGNGRKAEKQALADFELGYGGHYVVTPQLFTRIDIENWNPDLTIVDEIHTLNNPKKKGQKKLDALALQTGMRMALSGTPARRSFERNWSNMRFVWPHLKHRGQVAYSNYFLWMRDRMTFEEVPAGQIDWKPCTWEQYRNPPEGFWRKNIDGVPHIGVPHLVKKWLNEAEPGRLFSEAPCVLQHFRREECCEFHPEGFLPLEEPQVIPHEVPLHAKQKKIIKELEEQYLAWLDHQPLVTDLTITQKQRIRQVCLGVPTISYETVETEDGPEQKMNLDFDPGCVSPFADEVESILEKLEDDEPVVVYLESQRFAKNLVARLNKAGYSAAEYSGKTKKERDGYLARFGKDIQIIVGTITSIGTGTDGLQEISNTEIWIERSVDDTANEQTESRQDRLGAKGRVQRFVISDDLGYADGQFQSQELKRELMKRSTRRAT